MARALAVRTDLGRTPQTKPRAARPRSTKPMITLPSGSHTGGACQACGKPLAYWIAYKLCDTCLTVVAKPYHSSAGVAPVDTAVGRSFGVSGRLVSTAKRTGSGKG